jgi:acyl-CoA synthetase (AMP-forming)/AMP-acid ligase II
MATSHPEATAWHNLADGSDLTFGAWDAGSNQLARGLTEWSLVRGERVVIAVGPDEPFPWLVAYTAVHRAGAVAVPVNTRLAGPELRTILAHAEPSVVLAGTETSGGMRWDELTADVDAVRLVATTAGGGGSTDWSALVHPDASPLPTLPDPSRSVDIIYTDSVIRPNTVPIGTDRAS